MGCLLDSSAVIPAERARQTASEYLRSVERKVGDQTLVLSAIGYTELLHGLHRDPDLKRREARTVFFIQLLRYVPVIPYTTQVAERAGQLGGQQASMGNTIPPVDLMIGATALTLSYSVLTSNLRHFRLIPGLNVIPF